MTNRNHGDGKNEISKCHWLRTQSRVHTFATLIKQFEFNMRMHQFGCSQTAKMSHSFGEEWNFFSKRREMKKHNAFMCGVVSQKV